MKNEGTVKATVNTNRRYDIDWLRAIAVFSVIALHSAVIFSFGLFNVKHTQHTLILDTIVIFLSIWVVPLLFVLAGAASKFALDRKTPKEYRIERRNRLLVPAIVWFAIPAIGANIFHLDFLLHLPGNPSLAFTVVGTGHLWFILYLMLFSVVSLPLFVYLRTPSGKTVISGLARFCDKTGMIFLLALPLAGLPLSGTDNDLLKFFYLLYFIYGFILFSDDRFGEAIRKQTWTALSIGVILVGLFVYTSGHPLGVTGLPKDLVEVFARWCWVIALLGLGQRFLNHPGRLLRYLTEATYPIYILHFIITSLVGYYIAPLAWIPELKYLTIVVTSVAITMLTYDLLVKRTNVTRFLFGMKSKSVMNSK